MIRQHIVLVWMGLKANDSCSLTLMTAFAVCYMELIARRPSYLWVVVTRLDSI